MSIRLGTKEIISVRLGNSEAKIMQGISDISANYEKYIGEQKGYAFDGTVKKFTALYPGWYKLEAWGARGGGDGGYRSKGGYACGYIQLAKGEELYICAGGPGADGGYQNYAAAGGFNGGGAGESLNPGYIGGGGGCTHIARLPGLLADIGVANLNKVLLVAGGGGGMGFRADAQAYGGDGGGAAGGNGYGLGTATGGTQTGGAYFGRGGSLPHDQCQVCGGGGGGLYGGTVSWYTSGAGGSGYIGGVLDYNTVSKKSMTTGFNTEHGAAKITYFATR